MFKDVPRGVAEPGQYTEMTHDRPEDDRFLLYTNSSAVLILMPTWSKVVKIWKRLLISSKSDKPMIVLRRWDWDDGRTEQDKVGVYGFLERDPIGLARRDVNNWRKLVNEMRAEALAVGEPFPEDSQLRCQTVNEPDTNRLATQIDVYNFYCCKLGFDVGIFFLTHNFGTGHPAPQIGGPGTSPDYKPYKKSMIAARRWGHTIGSHEYYNRNGIDSVQMLYWHTMRHYWAWKFLVEWGIEDIDWWITEWGFEGLVDGDMPEHQGWFGILSPEQFEDDFYWFATNVACFIKRVFIFTLDLPDRTWWTYNPRLAGKKMIKAHQDIWKVYDRKGPVQCTAGTIPPDSDLTHGPMWPCDGRLTQRFGENPEDYIAYNIPAHNGIDIAAEEGTQIVAAGDGVVKWSDWDDAYGWYVRIWHPQYYFHSFYGHMKEKAIITGGENVKQGQMIGQVGSTGNSTGPHLHFETRMGEETRYFNVTEGYRRGRSNPEAIYAAYGLEW